MFAGRTGSRLDNLTENKKFPRFYVFIPSKKILFLNYIIHRKTINCIIKMIKERKFDFLPICACLISREMLTSVLRHWKFYLKICVFNTLKHQKVTFLHESYQLFPFFNPFSKTCTSLARCLCHFHQDDSNKDKDVLAHPLKLADYVALSKIF